MDRYVAIVVGSGPNGLSAAVTIAGAGRSVLMVEGAEAPGGGTRTEELTLPEYRHDVCSAVHPLGIGSPFFRSLPLQDHGLRWLQPEVALAHPLDGDTGAALHRDLESTVAGLGEDGKAWRDTVGRVARDWDGLEEAVLGPLVRIPRRPLPLAGFGLTAALPATVLARRFSTPEARALFAGCAAHAFQPLGRPFTSSFGLVLGGLGHRFGWPFAAGGSQAIADALVGVLRSRGGEIETGRWVDDLADLPRAAATLLDVSPSAALRLGSERIASVPRRLMRGFRPGPAAYKVDYALSGSVPWSYEPARRAGTVHVGGTIEEIAAAESACSRGVAPARPFLVVAQPTLVDPSRTPDGGHVLWVYAHVPSGSTDDWLPVVEAQLERFAPGFGDLVLARSAMNPAQLEAKNPNLVDGDIGGGANSLRQLVFRPKPAIDPYRLGAGLYLCSASTPPGGGAHGMCGYHAARSALRRELA